MKSYYYTLVFILALFLVAPAALAWGNETNVTNIENNTSITTGVSSDELSAGLALAGASGGHQLDFSTQDWQGSVTYAVMTDDTDIDAVSFALGKRWDKFANILMHVSYTPEPNNSDADFGDLVVIGTTWRF